MSVKGKHTWGITVAVLLILLLAVLTIRLSGHKHSLGILAFGVITIDVIAIFIGSILKTVDIFTRRIHRVYIGLIALLFIAFILYHRSYDSYNETRRIFWGLNGEQTHELEGKHKNPKIVGIKIDIAYAAYIVLGRMHRH